MGLILHGVHAWNARMQLADAYGRGRMFIAGDAAHQNPPCGGHGFNTGIGDAVNIGWKIAAVLNGWAPPALLETYEAERRPVAAETVAEAARNMATLATELAGPGLAGTDEEFAAALPSARAAIHRTAGCFAPPLAGDLFAVLLETAEWRRAWRKEIMVPKHRVAVIGAASSAGSHHVGQDRAPAALRAAGFVSRLLQARLILGCCARLDSGARFLEQLATARADLGI